MCSWDWCSNLYNCLFCSGDDDDYEYEQFYNSNSSNHDSFHSSTSTIKRDYEDNNSCHSSVELLEAHKYNLLRSNTIKIEPKSYPKECVICLGEFDEVNTNCNINLHFIYNL
jgi:hypothetical protein